MGRKKASPSHVPLSRPSQPSVRSPRPSGLLPIRPLNQIPIHPRAQSLFRGAFPSREVITIDGLTEIFPGKEKHIAKSPVNSNSLFLVRDGDASDFVKK